MVLSILAVVAAGVLGYALYDAIRTAGAMASLGPEAPVRIVDGRAYRDLNKNGVMDPYEDTSAPVEDRVQDVLARMTLEEKAGTMFINMIAMQPDGSLLERPTPDNPFTFIVPTNTTMIVRRKMNHFNILQVSDPAAIARWYNSVQRLAERSRLRGL